MTALHTKEELKRDLEKWLVPGDKVLIHTSYKALGGLEGGAAAFFEAFQEILGEKGTLIVPALSYNFVTAQSPVFDREKTPSCIGYLPEYFRTNVEGVVRSLHPTHSCCVWGRLARELTAEHELDETPVGRHSPFAYLPQLGGKILMIGCSADHNTSMHGVEETAEPPYLFERTKRIEYILRDGDRTVKQSALRHWFGENHCYAQRYSRIVPLLAEKEKASGKLLEADTQVLSAAAVWEKGHEKLLEDPFYFVEKLEKP